MESDTPPEDADGEACQEHRRATVCAGREATKGAGTRTQPMADTRPSVLLRYRSGVLGLSARTVHLAPLPTGDASEIRALCGALLPSDHLESCRGLFALSKYLRDWLSARVPVPVEVSCILPVLPACTSIPSVTRKPRQKTHTGRMVVAEIPLSVYGPRHSAPKNLAADS